MYYISTTSAQFSNFVLWLVFDCIMFETQVFNYISRVFFVLYVKCIIMQCMYIHCFIDMHVLVMFRNFRNLTYLYVLHLFLIFTFSIFFVVVFKILDHQYLISRLQVKLQNIIIFFLHTMYFNILQYTNVFFVVFNAKFTYNLYFYKYSDFKARGSIFIFCLQNITNLPWLRRKSGLKCIIQYLLKKVSESYQ